MSSGNTTHKYLKLEEFFKKKLSCGLIYYSKTVLCTHILNINLYLFH